MVSFRASGNSVVAEHLAGSAFVPILPVCNWRHALIYLPQHAADAQLFHQSCGGTKGARRPPQIFMVSLFDMRTHTNIRAPGRGGFLPIKRKTVGFRRHWDSNTVPPVYTRPTLYGLPSAIILILAFEQLTRGCIGADVWPFILVM